MKYFLPFYLLVLIVSCQEPKNSSQTFQQEWSFRMRGDTTWLPATVPGVVHLDLLKNKLIDDPYRSNNEVELAWIEKKNWEYQTIWTVDEELLENDHIELAFGGLDTYAKVYLNGRKILTADNMFREWKIDVKLWLKEGPNKLKIVFTSPVNKNSKLAKNYKYKLPSGNETVRIKVGSFTRKAAYHFGWDWGPRFVNVGVWRPIELNIWNDVRITDVFVDTKKIDAGQATVKVRVALQVDESATYALKLNDQEYEEKLDSGAHVKTYDLLIQNPLLWWPNGMGSQHLYNLKVTLSKEGSFVEEKQKQFGIRTIELVTEPDSAGTAYFFKINREAFFARGANYIPQDMFLPRVTEERYRSMIAQVKDANMNMLRVWGGGIYENDQFYDLCDQNGILVWQDFMFAGSMYPKEDAFHQSVIAEARDNITRLRSHPSLALWCGNNEIEVAWRSWGWQKGFRYSTADSTELWENYVKIFREEIPNQVSELSPSIPYVPTSPLSNWGNAQNFNHSSMHYWGVWHGREPFEKFQENVPRFMVEYGFQSFPSYASLAKVIDADKMVLKSDVMTNRQKSYIGNEMITLFAEKYYGKAPDFATYVINSQKTQALAYKMAIQAHRLGKPHCMGTMFWQLNDCWQGPSWSIAEFDGTPKLAFAEVKKWYSPVIAVANRVKDELTVSVVSDLRGVTSLQLEVKNEEGVMYTKEINVASDKVEVVKIPVNTAGKYEVLVRQNGEVIFQDQVQ